VVVTSSRPAGRSPSVVVRLRCVGALTPTVVPVRLVAVVPAHTIADGEYDDLAAGRLAALGFALQVLSTAAATEYGVVQIGTPVPTTTITGTVLRPGDEVPPVLEPATSSR
jgi:hypothetical protein